MNFMEMYEWYACKEKVDKIVSDISGWDFGSKDKNYVNDRLLARILLKLDEINENLITFGKMVKKIEDKKEE